MIFDNTERNKLMRFSSLTAIITSGFLNVVAVMAAPSSAQEEVILPFMAAEYYQRNISLKEFNENPRLYFRSEAAFDLLVDFIADEIGRPLTGREFIALMRSDKVLVRDCSAAETLTTGALRQEDSGLDFYWFSRTCRPGEQIVQLKIDKSVVDLFSLNCLNAVEEKMPVAVPTLTPRLSTVALSPESYKEVESTARWVCLPEHTHTEHRHEGFLLPGFAIPLCSYGVQFIQSLYISSINNDPPTQGGFACGWVQQ